MSLVLVGNRIGKAMHSVKDELIGARLLGWMVRESNGANWWVAGVAGDGRLLAWDSSAQGHIEPPKEKKYYAIRVITALHQLGELPGTWLVGWLDDCKRFYLLYKDQDGDIQIPIECDKSWLVIREWEMDTWVKMAVGAYGQWLEFHENMEYSKGQKIMLAAGQKPKH